MQTIRFDLATHQGAQVYLIYSRKARSKVMHDTCSTPQHSTSHHSTPHHTTPESFSRKGPTTGGTVRLSGTAPAWHHNHEAAVLWAPSSSSHHLEIGSQIGDDRHDHGGWAPAA
jgi:hypothetical protein